VWDRNHKEEMSKKGKQKLKGGPSETFSFQFKVRPLAPEWPGPAYKGQPKWLVGNRTLFRPPSGVGLYCRSQPLVYNVYMYLSTPCRAPCDPVCRVAACHPISLQLKLRRFQHVELFYYTKSLVHAPLTPYDAPCDPLCLVVACRQISLHLDFDDSNMATVELFYMQALQEVIDAKYPCTEQDNITLGALQVGFSTACVCNTDSLVCIMVMATAVTEQQSGW
jgi:hypothetical protein